MNPREADAYSTLARQLRGAEHALLNIKDALGGDTFLEEPDTLDAYE